MAPSAWDVVDELEGKNVGKKEITLPPEAMMTGDEAVERALKLWREIVEKNKTEGRT